MPRVVDYRLIRAPLGSQFESTMKQALKDGWQPYGQVSKDPGNASYVMHAVVRYAPDAVDEIAYVASSDLVELSEKVSNRVQEEWIPYGSVAMGTDRGAVFYCQTMVRSTNRGD